MEAIRHGNTIVLVMDARSASYLLPVLEEAKELTEYKDADKVINFTCQELRGVLEEHEPRYPVEGKILNRQEETGTV